MTYLQMKYFSAVCETGNISKAASQLCVSRVTISRTITELERELGLPLFSRIDTGFVLTEQGRLLHEKCLEIEHAVDVLDVQMRNLRERTTPGAARTIRVGVTPTTAVLVFPRFVEAVHRAGLNVRLMPVEYNRLHSMHALENGTMDFHLSADADPRKLLPIFSRCKLMDTRLAFCMHPAHPLAACEAVTAEDIRGEELICLQRTYQPDEMIERFYLQSGYFPRVKHRSFQLSTVQGLVQEGCGCSIQMEHAIDDGVHVLSRPLTPEQRLEICLVWNRVAPHNRAFSELLDFVRTADWPAALDQEVRP